MTIAGDRLTLTWGDFRARVPARAQHDAYTSTTYTVNTTFSMRIQGGTQSDFRLATVSIRVTLERGRMWSRASARTAALLKHEQIHFDITALVMRDLHTDLAALLQSAQTYPTQADVEQAIADLQDPAVAMIDSIQSTPTVDGIYDQQTGHGTNNAAQQTWNAAVAAARAGSGSRFADALRSRGITIP